MRFKLDWKTGPTTWKRYCSVRSRTSSISADHSPSTVFPKRRYMPRAIDTSAIASTPIRERRLPPSGLWIERGDLAMPVALSVGSRMAAACGAAFQGWTIAPPDTAHAMFLWCDLNGDGRPQPDEISYRPAVSAGSPHSPTSRSSWTIDRTRLVLRCGDSRHAGVLVYDLSAGEAVAEGGRSAHQLPAAIRPSSGPQGSSVHRARPNRSLPVTRRREPGHRNLVLSQPLAGPSCIA